MLFNSYTFIFLFLPICLIGFRLAFQYLPKRARFVWLVACSLVFYGWWNFSNWWVLGFLLVATYGLGIDIGRHAGRRRGRLGVAAGVALNLAFLAYYKYSFFLGTTWNAWTPWPVAVHRVLLPLGISFYVFQKIAYLVDSYRGETANYQFLDFVLFVTFFPQLIAGPIVHHKEVVPQFENPPPPSAWPEDLSVGLTQFVFGLVKKVMIADSVAVYANQVFGAAASGGSPGFAESWGGALAYTFQIYFDFSGYSDMALGLGRLFGIRLPMNFNSPYKAQNIADFWRRWHMTLSRFLRDYLYIPLGGNRKGPFRRYANLMVTMLLGGLWHGAGWTFLAWGGLHGIFLALYHGWNDRRPKRSAPAGINFPGRVVTFLAVVAAWVFFRADSFTAAGSILRGMAGLNGFERTGVLPSNSAFSWSAGLLLVCWFFPNTHELLARFRPVFGSEASGVSDRWWRWKPTAGWAFIVLVMALATLMQLARESEFIYWQF